MKGAATIGRWREVGDKHIDLECGRRHQARATSDDASNPLKVSCSEQNDFSQDTRESHFKSTYQIL